MIKGSINDFFQEIESDRSGDEKINVEEVDEESEAKQEDSNTDCVAEVSTVSPSKKRKVEQRKDEESISAKQARTFLTFSDFDTFRENFPHRKTPTISAKDLPNYPVTGKVL